MSRELIEAAKAVIADRDRLGAMFEWEGNDVLPSPNTLRWQAFVSAVRAAEAAPVADAERVREAATKAVVYMQNGEDPSRDVARQRINAVADAIRPYINPAPVADTVAVPVETLRELRLIATKPLTDQDCRNVCAAVRATVDALLPPPPAPEPSEELVAEWEREAAEYAKATHTDGGFIRPVIRGYVAARRAEWAKKGGG